MVFEAFFDRSLSGPCLAIRCSSHASSLLGRSELEFSSVKYWSLGSLRNLPRLRMMDARLTIVAVVFPTLRVCISHPSAIEATSIEAVYFLGSIVVEPPRDAGFSLVKDRGFK